MQMLGAQGKRLRICCIALVAVAMAGCAKESAQRLADDAGTAADAVSPTPDSEAFGPYATAAAYHLRSADESDFNLMYVYGSTLTDSDRDDLKRAITVPVRFIDRKEEVWYPGGKQRTGRELEEGRAAVLQLRPIEEKGTNAVTVTVSFFYGEDKGNGAQYLVELRDGIWTVTDTLSRAVV
jgi:hypothetical protein